MRENLKGGSQMRTKNLFIGILLACMAVSMAFAAGTPAGTAITNYAIGEYQDANGNQLPNVQSNTVTTIVSQVAGIDINPASSASNVVLYGTVSFPFTLTNTGNGEDKFDLTKAIVENGGGTNTAVIYHDANGNGVVDDNEAAVTATSALAADATYDIVVVVTNVDGNDGSYATVTMTGTSQFNSTVSDASVMVATVSTSVFAYTMIADDQTPQPGDVVTYTLTATNSGSATAKSVVVSNNIATNTTFVSGSLEIEGASASDASDNDGAQYSGGTVSFELGDILSGGSSYATFQVVVNDDVPVGTVVNNSATLLFNNILDEQQAAVSAVSTGATLTIAQIYFVSVGADATDVGDPSDYVYYAVTVTNTGNGPDVMNISYTNTLTSFTFYLDANKNGVIDEGENVLTDSNNDGTIDVGTLTQGAIAYVVAKAQIPAGTADATVSVMTMTATSAGNASESDSGNLTVTVTAPILSLLKAVSPQGNQPPGTTLTYTVTVMNSGTGEATSVVISDVIPMHTLYKDGSMKIGSDEKTDAVDGDGGTKTVDSVVFTIPTLSAGGTTTVSFQTVIN
jgi:uncharacterized repeat protein (TIGR01451 family)